MSYFEDYHNKLKLPMKLQEVEHGLRECQVGAFWATCAHFTASNSPPLIVMPTGAGKTAVMMLLAFGLKASRVLVITPAVILRDQTAKKFRSLDILFREKVLPKGINKPKVHIQEGRITSEKMWNKLRRYDVVVATPHTISPGQHEDIVLPPDDLFDLVFFDEAHHTPAPTWDDLLKAFKRSKRILLTATPFRKDKRKVRAHMVYNYPLGRALDSGIYQPIEYHPIAVRSQEEKDKLLCKKASQLMTAEKKKSHRTKILIRTNRVRKCKSLINLYKSQGILIDEVNYQKSLRENKAVLDKIKKDELDGIVCIGMLGEGLDIPELKMAILHDPPQSLAFTLQFIGRISRPARGKIGDAHVIANPDDVKGKMRILYRQDAHWRDLVPKLVEEAVGKVAEQSKFHQAGLIVGDLDIDPKEIAPFFSARLYNVDPEDLSISTGTTLDLGDNIDIPFIEYLDDGNFLILITDSEYRPPWAKSLAFYLTQYDLHLYYYHRLSKTLFETTTSDAIAAEIRRQIINGEIKRRGGDELISVMQSQESMNYLMVGLANVLGQSPSLPTYKILMGKEVQGALRPTEGRVFTPGHALAQISREETRGIGNFQGRVWAIKRASLLEYKDWCDAIGNQLVRDKAAISLPGMEFLPNPQRVEKFPGRPIAALFDYRTFGFSLTLVRIDPRLNLVALDIQYPEFALKKLSMDMRTLSLCLYPNARDKGIALIYNVSNNQWTIEGNITYKVKVDTGDAVKEFKIEEFLLEYPPLIYLDYGGVIINGELYKSKHTFSALPDECIHKGIDWSKCDITVEFVDEYRGKYPKEGKLTVHDWLEENLKHKTSKSAIILKDHTRGEIADFVVVEPRDKTISLYHCKASRKNTPSATISDLKVLEQILRSINWVRKSDLLSEIVVRVTGKSRPNSIIVKGTKKMLENLAIAFRANQWKYQVVMVHPGLDCGVAVKRQNTNTLLLNCFEWLYNMDASLLIIGH